LKEGFTFGFSFAGAKHLGDFVEAMSCERRRTSAWYRRSAASWAISCGCRARRDHQLGGFFGDLLVPEVSSAKSFAVTTLPGRLLPRLQDALESGQCSPGDGARRAAAHRLEAGARSGVARRSCRVDADQDGVLIAVEPHGAHGLGIAAGLALDPQLAAVRLQKVARPVSRVWRRLSRFIQASMRTSPEAASCTMAGQGPAGPI